jgi:mono/diheme cytochrome c family protein
MSLPTTLAFPMALALSVLVHLNRAAESPLPSRSDVVRQAGVPSTPAEQGKALFGRNCAHCHGEDARGDEGPSLYDLRKTDTRIREIIQQGVKGEMPKFITKFNDAEVQALIAYLRTLKSQPSVPQS